jgi:6-phosphogluconolactonase
MAMTDGDRYQLYIGSYNQDDGDGIHVYSLDAKTGALTPQSSIGGVKNPSFLAVHPSGRFLYAVSEVAKSNGEAGGGVSAFQVDGDSGALSPLNETSSMGQGPCHLSVEQTGRYVLVANYSSGSVAMVPLGDDGRLEEASDFVQHEGSSVDPRRQQGPHAHSITVGPGNRCAYAADLGLDQVLVYRMDLEQGKLVPNDPPSAAVTPGQGPRHFAFHPNQKFGYVINEMGNTVTAYAYDGAGDTLTEVQMISTLPDGYAETSYCADIHISASGRFLYGSNRGHDSIAVFGIDGGTGLLDPLGYTSTGGKNPRNFAIDPSGRFLLAANQDTDNIVVLRIDAESGKLTETGVEVQVPKPVCIKFVQMPA